MAYRVTILKLQNNEGTLSAILDSDSSNESYLMNHTIGSSVLIHDGDIPKDEDDERCGGSFEDIHISANKHVLVCSNCSLRLSIPVSAVSLNHLLKSS